MFNCAYGGITYTQNRTALGVDNIFSYCFNNGLIFQIDSFNPVSEIDGCGIKCYFNIVTGMESLTF